MAIARRTQPSMKRDNYISENSLAVIFNGKPNSLYQLKLWLPALEALGVNFDILVRNEELWAPIQKLTKSRVFLVDSYGRVTKNPKLKLIFYVNNAPFNSESVKFTQITHVQLLHGDSEKTASFNPVSAMFTKIFVSGQAGADRYKRNGVLVHPEKFVLVGRPQLSEIEVLKKPMTLDAKKTILIAPTWGGSSLGETYSSLSLVPRFAKQLISAGHRIIFRPHPFSHTAKSDRAIIERVTELLRSDNEQNATGHVFGAEAETLRTVNDCINQSDVLVSDLSGIVSDWLYSLKPYVLLSMDASAKDFQTRYPIAEGGTVMTPVDESIIEFISGETNDTFKKREKVRSYYIEGAGKRSPGELFKLETLKLLKY